MPILVAVFLCGLLQGTVINFLNVSLYVFHLTWKTNIACRITTSKFGSLIETVCEGWHGKIELV